MPLAGQLADEPTRRRRRYYWPQLSVVVSHELELGARFHCVAVAAAVGSAEISARVHTSGAVVLC